jgi:RecG-like helicase
MRRHPSHIGTLKLKHYAEELGDRVVEQFPPLHKPGDAPSPLLRKLKRQPFPGQQLAVMGILKKWQDSRAVAAAIIAECGTGKTLIALASVYAAAEGRGFAAIAMVPPQPRDPVGAREMECAINDNLAVSKA